MIKFDALLLIDCWGESWFEKEKPLNVLPVYFQMIDFFSNLEFDQVFFGSSFNPSYCEKDDVHRTHSIFENLYPKHRYISGVKELYTKHLSRNSKILVGGGAWKMCLHYRKELCFGKLRRVYHVYSHPKIVYGPPFIDNSIITSNDFRLDFLPWQEVDNVFYLNRGRNILMPT